MSSADAQEKLKQEAKAIRERLSTLIDNTDEKQRMIRAICVYAGLITETLIEYEEPDIVMEQAFHRIADLLRCDPAEGDTEESPWAPLAYDVDHDTELGRHLARKVAANLPKGMDDVHEIAIALIISDFPEWEKAGHPRREALRLLIEAVIASLTFEMATQDFCDLLIDDFLADGRTPADGIVALGFIAGYLFARARQRMPLPDDAEEQLGNVMVRESLCHDTPGTRRWSNLAAANDTEIKHIPEHLEVLMPEIEEFFALIGLENPLGQAVAVAKAAGRMVAVITVEDVGQIHPSIAKSLAKTAMILGAKLKDGQ